MFVERARTVAASADAEIVGSQARIEIQIVTATLPVRIKGGIVRRSNLGARQASCRISEHSLSTDRSDWPLLISKFLEPLRRQRPCSAWCSEYCGARDRLG